VVAASDARVWGEAGEPRGTVRWCSHCGSVKPAGERWYQPRSAATAEKLWRNANGPREVRRAS
jgi:hypothetical protein